MRSVRLAILVPLAAMAPAQNVWSPAYPLPKGGPATFDGVRQRPILVPGVDGIWTWNGLDWQSELPRVVPPTPLVALAWDDARARLVGWNGSNGVTEWDGAAFQQPLQPAAPPVRETTALAYDSARGNTVLFGGAITVISGHTPFPLQLGDTWTWNGSQWSQRVPAVSPPARYGHGLAYDVQRQRVVLFGGQLYPSTYFNDTWEWDGSAWSPITPSASPAPRAGFGFAYDSVGQTAILFGGIGNVSSFVDTWSWNGTTWTQVATGTGPGVREAPTLVTDTLGVLLVGGRQLGWGERQDTWLLAGGQWVSLPTAAEPGGSRHMNLAYDAVRGEVVHVAEGTLPSGTSPLRTWTWNGSWHLRTPSVVPPSAGAFELCGDDASGQTLLFGNQGTWIWDGSTWNQFVAATAPAPRTHHAMAYDPVRQRVLLFGGLGTTTFGDAWLWDGLQWTQTAGGPAARYNHALEFDAARSAVVLAGGAAATALTDTWEWSGTWQQRATTGAPLLGEPASAHDPVTGNALLFDAGSAWQWNGATWSQVPSSLPLTPGAAAVNDARRGRILALPLLIGPYGATADLWVLGPSPAGAARGTAGCGSGIQADLSLLGRPVPGGSVEFLVRAPAAGAPTFVMIGLTTVATPVGSGCTLGVGTHIATLPSATNAGGAATNTVVIPGDLALRGLAVATQAAAIVPGGPVLGFALSRDLVVHIGD